MRRPPTPPRWDRHAVVLAACLVAAAVGAVAVEALHGGAFVVANCLLWVVIPLGVAAAVRLLLWRALPRPRPRDPGRCWRCGYDLRGLPGDTCPECGEFNYR